MATYVDTRTAADNECTYQGLIRCAVYDYIVSKDMWRLVQETPSMIMLLTFHIEQCTEKLLKAIIAHAGQHYPHCSNIRRLEKRVIAIDESLVPQWVHDNARFLSRNAGRQGYEPFNPDQYDVDRVRGIFDQLPELIMTVQDLCGYKFLDDDMDTILDERYNH